MKSIVLLLTFLVSPALADDCLRVGQKVRDPDRRPEIITEATCQPEHVAYKVKYEDGSSQRFEWFARMGAGIQDELPQAISE